MKTHSFIKQRDVTCFRAAGTGQAPETQMKRTLQEAFRLHRGTALRGVWLLRAHEGFPPGRSPQSERPSQERDASLSQEGPAGGALPPPPVAGIPWLAFRGKGQWPSFTFHTLCRRLGTKQSQPRTGGILYRPVRRKDRRSLGNTAPGTLCRPSLNQRTQSTTGVVSLTSEGPT